MPSATASLRDIHGFCPAAAAALLLLCHPVAQGQTAAENVGRGEFPGLQFLPVGSVLKGISVPRYENHRVTALFTADTMLVKSRSMVVFRNLRAHLYDKNGDTTDLEIGEAPYDFAHCRISSATPIRLVSPRIEVHGAGLVYDSKNQVGLIKGPVETALQTDRTTATQQEKKH